MQAAVTNVMHSVLPDCIGHALFKIQFHLNITLAMWYVCLCCFKTDIKILPFLIYPKINTLVAHLPGLPASMGAGPGHHDCLRSVCAASVLNYYVAWYLPFHIQNHHIHVTLGPCLRRAVYNCSDVAWPKHQKLCTAEKPFRTAGTGLGKESLSTKLVPGKIAGSMHSNLAAKEVAITASSQAQEMPSLSSLDINKQVILAVCVTLT